MLLNLTKGTREYILKSERPEYWATRIKELEEKLAKASLEDKDEIQEELEEARKKSAELEEKLTKYGPTIWLIESASKADIARKLAKVNINLGDMKSVGRMEKLTSGHLSYTTLQHQICVEIGLKGWRNLRNPNIHYCPQCHAEYAPGGGADGEGQLEGKKVCSKHSNQALSNEVPFDEVFVNQLPDIVTTELAQEISGFISEELEKNS